MSKLAGQDKTLTSKYNAAFKENTSSRTNLSPLTLRLTREERKRLEELSGQMTLSAYVRACVFADDSKLQQTRATDLAQEKKLAAEALALLGQSRIASNLNQLAYHANIGVLIVGESEKAQIAEANAYLADIRARLMEALGKKRKPTR